MRREHDCLGERDLDDALYYGVQTLRAFENFPISGIPVVHYPLYIDRLARIKRAAALANRDCGALDPAIADAISKAVEKLLASDFAKHFPLDIYQGGGYTSSNMNMNEVLAHMANEIMTGHKGYDAVHPNTHVNMGQSTNDVMPSAMRLYCIPGIDGLIEVLEGAYKVTSAKAKEFAHVVKVGRTCIQDALPITLGQEFSAYASMIQRNIDLLKAIRPESFALTVGGTAIGTCLGTADGYIEKFYAHLSQDLGEKVYVEENLFDGMQNPDYYVRLHALIKSIASCFSKIARDMRLMSSGPRAGFGEITIPAVQAGSSIMPGKINPVMPEVVNQIAYQVCGNDVAISMACEGGELDLNVWEPVFLKNIAESFNLVTNGVREFTHRCLAGVVANEAVCAQHANNTLALATVTAATLGYEEGVRVAQYAANNNCSVREAALALNAMTEEDADILLDPALLTNADKTAEVLQAWKKKKGLI